MSELIYLNDDLDSTVDRILLDEELGSCGLGKRKVTKALKSFQGDEIATSVFLKKYALRDNDNMIVEYTLEEAKDRWAKAVMEAERSFTKNINEDDSVKYFRELYEYFLPAGRQMYALGNPFVSNATLSNCYVVDLEDDSIEGIFDAAKKMAKTYSYGGGVGLCIGKLRPRGSRVSNSAKHSTGAVSFMELYSMTTGLIGQCVAKGERVLTDNGLVSIEQIETGNNVWTKRGFKKVTKTFKNGPKQIFKITDQFGFQLKVSEDHIVMSEENGQLKEVAIKDMEVGDSIVLIPGTPISKSYVELDEIRYQKLNCANKSNRLNESVNLPKHINEKFAYILGYSYGDGCVEFDKFNDPCALELACSNDWPEIKTQLKQYITEVFEYESKLCKGDGDLEKLSLHSKVILHWLKGNYILKQKAHELIFPEKILQSPSSVQMAFISGFFDADGKKINGKRGYAISIVAHDFLQQIKIVLMANGVASKNNFEFREDVGWRNLHGITIAGNYAQSKARELLGMSVKVREANFVSQRDSYITPFKSKSFNIKYNNYSYCPGDTYLSCGCFEKLKKEGHLLPHTLIKSSVTSIEECGLCDTFDIQLEDEHMFFCEGFQIHNSGRRGALLLSIPVDHPDIEDFIEMKSIDMDRVRFANLSVKITDKFMNAVANNEEFELSYKTSHETISKTIRARDLWDKIITAAHSSAEPGILFFDTAKKMSPSDTYPGMEIQTTNPCGEIWLEKGSACCLGSLLLHKFVDNPYTEKASFNYDLFKSMVGRGVRHLDNIIELNLNRHALEEQKEAAINGRRIGLGITGLADMLVSLGIKYDSNEALECAKNVMSAKLEAEYVASANLGKERGSFKFFDKNKHFERGFCKLLPKHIIEYCKNNGLRNVTISTVAPSGSVSIIGQCSSGIEPIFSLQYKRYVELGRNRKGFKIYHQGLVRWFIMRDDEDDINENLSDLPNYWVVSHNIDYKFRIRMQSIIQSMVDSSISSTINLPSDVSPEVVGQIYMEAWREGLKGITVYREGSREGILITEDFAKKAGIPDMDTAIKCVRAEGGDKFYIMVSYKDGDIKNPYQVFVLNYKRIENDSFVKISNGLIRMLSIQGVSAKRIQKYIDRSQNSLVKLTRFLSLSMKTGNLDKAVEMLEEHAFVGSLAARLHTILSDSLERRKALCKNCKSSNVRMEEGCMRCLDCNWSGCN